MTLSQSLTALLKKLFFRQTTKHAKLQSLWSRLHTLSIFGMNYGGGGLIETSGEVWVLSNTVRQAFRDVDSPVVFDVGANVGDYSLLAKEVLPGAEIYAFEPSHTTYQQLLWKLGAAGEANIKPFNLGFSDSQKTVELYSYSIEGQDVSLLSSIDRRLPTQVVAVETVSEEAIQVQTLDNFCAAQMIPRIDFLKLDVEGHEMPVLRGAQKMLGSGAISIIQFEFGPANIYSRTFFYDFWSLLSEQFDLFRIIPQGIAPITFYGEHLEIFLTTNYLAIKKSVR